MIAALWSAGNVWKSSDTYGDVSFQRSSNRN